LKLTARPATTRSATATEARVRTSMSGRGGWGEGGGGGFDRGYVRVELRLVGW
jgi:hypothetical protein